MSLDQYLAFEEKSPGKHEYVGGEVYAMSGPTLRHGRIVLNIAAHLRSAARSHGCSTFVSEIKVLAAGDRVYYPDVIIACGKAAEVDLMIESPSLIAEVTSPSTRATDRREKLDAYLKIASLSVYLIIEQRRCHVIAYVRDASGEWQRDEIQIDGEIPIPFLDMRLSLNQVYEDVTLPPLSVREENDWNEAEWADYVAEDA